MRHHNGLLLFSASDLTSHLGCEHATVLSLIHLEEGLERAVDDEETAFVQAKGLQHEQALLEQFERQNIQVIRIPENADLAVRCTVTREAMEAGADIVYQAAFLEAPWHGFADFLRKTEIPSSFGNYSYEVLDTKLSRTAKPAHIIQLCIYSELLTQRQGTRPHSAHIILGDGREESFRLAEFEHYYKTAKQRFEHFISKPPDKSYPEPCQACGLCPWRNLCGEQWITDDHLSQVANIQRSQIQKLYAEGITTVAALAEMPEDMRVPRTQPETISRLVSQARLQVHKRTTGDDIFEILPVQEGRGFNRLPEPSSGDVFFDIEGNPFYPDGLEYLFGVCFQADEEVKFRPFWGHDHALERAAFVDLMAFFGDRLSSYPDAHIYHYATYEEQALKRLSTRYAVCEDQVDDLLRRHKFVDLYKVVREGVRVSEPSYSIKNLETFYRGAREGDVQTGAESIVIYERWIETRDDALLRSIEAYNEEDVRSTLELRDWLIALRPPESEWYGSDGQMEGQEVSLELTEAEVQHQSYREHLQQTGLSPHAGLTADLLEFHRRAAKPAWWAMFDRQNRETEELIDDAECLGGLREKPGTPRETVKQSTVVTYEFPEQESKFKDGDRALIAASLTPAGTIETVDYFANLVSLKRGNRSGDLPKYLSIVPGGPIDTRPLRRAIYRYADSVIAEDGKYSAITALLNRDLPDLEGRQAGQPIIPDGTDIINGTVAAAQNLKESYLLIQGPPGAGKTYTSSRVIVELLRSGARIGVSANSHKAIHNLLAAVEVAAIASGVSFWGLKKASFQNPESHYEGEFISSVTENNAVDPTADLIAGMAWLFSTFDQDLDFLFIDEAGQVSLANIVAMGVSTRNLILVGDQMQLGQPIQGSHPGDTGLSVLDYLLRDYATIPPERGIFLPTTWRMNPDVCRFISDAVYEGRLQPEAQNENQRLVLKEDAHPALRPTGLSFVPMDHEGCSQRSDEEASAIKSVYQSLLKQEFVDRTGQKRELEAEDILVVAPYNMQVNHLTDVLPNGARVGTVDKFQGQEAEVVLISMTTSSGDDLPRNVEFLYSKNRLNVAVSRARCLSVILANTKLMEIPCSTIDQMRLVNTLCWAREYADTN